MTRERLIEILFDAFERQGADTLEYVGRRFGDELMLDGSFDLGNIADAVLEATE